MLMTAELEAIEAGVYRVDVFVDGKKHIGMLSVGIRPTFGVSEKIVEVHILDFDRDIYDKEIAINNLKFIRKQHFFSSKEELIEAIKTDVASCVENVICVENLTKKFGDFVAVDSISFSVKKAEIFGFLGANGAGKTTAMKMICGLLEPTSGKGTVAGFDIFKEANKIKENIGYMSQKFSLYNDLKVWENIKLFAGIYGLSLQEIKVKTNEILEKLDLQEQKNTIVSALPLGWKQKLAFSIAIIHKPNIVFLDEPTGGVDPVARRLFWEMIYEAAEMGITVFVTTHYMDEAEYCNRVSVMVDGKIKAMGSPKDLKREYQCSSFDEVFTKLARNQ
jgi:ABC-2 type transport system ATP-binding protein